MQNIIKSIKITNVKGFGEQSKELSGNLYSGKINICVAPNGFGKSSLAKAFEGLRKISYKIDEEDKNDQCKSKKSSLELIIGDQKYVADDSKNDISRQLDVHVIHNRVYAEHKSKKTQYKTHVKSYIGVKKISICKSISKPKNISIKRVIEECYNVNQGVFAKVKIDELMKKLSQRDEVSKIFKKINYNKNWEAMCRAVPTKIRQLESSQTSNAAEDSGTELGNKSLSKYFLEFKNKYNFSGMDDLSLFCDFLVLIYIYKERNDYFKNMIKYSKYQNFREEIDFSIKSLNTTYRDIKTTIEKGELVIKFPDASRMSNGQRDVMTFTAELLKFRFSSESDRPKLLIIDDVFDYLDDANIMVAQYYLSELILRMKSKVYVVILTHLEPNSFRNYIFNKKRVNVVYWGYRKIFEASGMKALIDFRNRCKENNKDLYTKISNYMLHYYPEAQDIREDLKQSGEEQVRKVNISWGDTTIYKNYLIAEINKYFSGKVGYDHIAVAIALRLRTEKLAYDCLNDEEKKERFLTEHATKDKLALCEQEGIDIPSAYYVALSIHNELCHLNFSNKEDESKEKQIAHKLQNIAVTQILKTIFDFNGKVIEVSAI